jgi:hypothetical protein
MRVYPSHYYITPIASLKLPGEDKVLTSPGAGVASFAHATHESIAASHDLTAGEHKVLPAIA